jgi:hypothetical protein
MGAPHAAHRFSFRGAVAHRPGAIRDRDLTPEQGPMTGALESGPKPVDGIGIACKAFETASLILAGALLRNAPRRSSHGNRVGQ